MKRKVCIVTGTRAEWGLLSPIAALLGKRHDVELQIVATNMHLMEKYGLTVNTIIAEGFSVNARVPMEAESDSMDRTAAAMGRCMQGMADAFAELAPDVTVILGDRYEMLAVASAATVMRIPIVHLHGGEISEGAVDDSIRHAITKLSSLHLTSAEPHRLRVIQMGESPEMVHDIGSVGVENALKITPIPKDELDEFIGMTVDSNTLLVTYHPVTALSESPARLFGNLLDALDALPMTKVIFTYPNNDARGAALIDMITAYVAHNPGRAVAFPSLGMRRYMSVLRHAGAAVGNSSSGIIEVPSTGIPSVNIGNRQQGRLASRSVIHCADDTPAIIHAIKEALRPETRALAATLPNPYSKPGAAATAAHLIATTPLQKLRHKHFHDINIR